MRPRLTAAAPAAAICVAIVAVSSSGPLIAYAAAPALAIAFWRNGLAAVVLAPVAGVRRRDEMRTIVRRSGWSTLAGCVLAGGCLAVHFGTWVSSLKLTSVADATALVATQSVWQGLIAVGQGRRLGRTVWIGIGMAVAGALATTGVDISVSSRAVTGDVLALAGGVAAAAYTMFGERVRVSTSTISYTTICYTTCAALLGAACLASGTALGGYPGSAWLAILGLVAGAQLLGHSMINYALRRVPATAVSVLLLLEVPGATLVAWAWLGQIPGGWSIPGLTLLVAGVFVVAMNGRRPSSGGEGGPTAPVPDQNDVHLLADHPDLVPPRGKEL